VSTPAPSQASGPSLRGRLVALLVAVTTVVWGAAVAWSYFDARHEMGEMLDAQLAQSAQVLLAQAGHEIDEVPVTEIAAAHRYERRVAFQIWDVDGRKLLLRSESAPAERLSSRAEGFADRTQDDDAWRVYSRRDTERGLLVQVAERRAARDELAAAVAFHLLHPLLLALPLLALMIWAAIGRGLEPLDRVAHEVAARAPDNLAALDTAAAPREAQPLVRALNALFGRMRATLDRERRFTADAAHELRTPLAAVKTQAQVAQGAHAAAERDRALAQVVAGADRATRLVEQLLTLARLDPQEKLPTVADVELSAAALTAVSELGARAAAKEITVKLDAPKPVVIKGDATMIEALVRNLVDNALRYTQDGGAVAVRVATEGATAMLTVADNGPGIPAAERGRVFERFYRVAGTGESGSGLGLSIVRRIVELHHAVVSLADGPGGRGLTVQVRFAR
jgi:two-component system, OmpR family, sensor histidine kinase QseC